MTQFTQTYEKMAISSHSLLAQVGNTPLIQLHKITEGLPEQVRVFAKAEWFNPSGSFKDRVAISIIKTAIEDGSLSAGKRLLDSTSGNMGIAYATFCAALGIPVALALPANATQERITILRAFNVELILSDPNTGSAGAMQVARALAQQSPEKYFYANQYDNPANSWAHYHGTGAEIYAQTEQQITHFIAGTGTSGTLMGAGRYLREANPRIRLIAVQPDEAKHGLIGLKHMKSVFPMPQIYDEAFPDVFMEIGTVSARNMVRRLAQDEGLFVGPSSGAAAVAALEVARGLDAGTVVAVFPDSGAKYLSDMALWNGTECGDTAS